jgi:hypothetical protein
MLGTSKVTMSMCKGVDTLTLILLLELIIFFPILFHEPIEKGKFLFKFVHPKYRSFDT